MIEKNVFQNFFYRSLTYSNVKLTYRQYCLDVQLKFCTKLKKKKRKEKKEKDNKYEI